MRCGGCGSRFRGIGWVDCKHVIVLVTFFVLYEKDVLCPFGKAAYADFSAGARENSAPSAIF
jgi:hypothetical protein